MNIYKCKLNGLFYVVAEKYDDKYVRAINIEDKYSYTIPIEDLELWLEQEPCEDAISRAEAINALGYDISIESDGGLDEYKSVIKEMLCKIYDVQKANIERLPPVTPKPKTEVLDKIRAEIKEESRFCPLTEGLERALEIIDKYTAEKE